MLLHQFILVFVSAFKRFESVLLTIPERLRGAISGGDMSAGDLEEPETEQAA